MNEPQFIAEQFNIIRNRLATIGRGNEVDVIDYNPEPVSDYEVEHGVPYVVDKLQLNVPYIIDPQVKLKALAVDSFVRKIAKDEGSRDSTTSYQGILDRIIQRLPEPFERMMQAKKNDKVLDFMFGEAAIREEMSSETFLKVVEDRIKYQRISLLLNQLQKELV